MGIRAILACSLSPPGLTRGAMESERRGFFEAGAWLPTIACGADSEMRVVDRLLTGELSPAWELDGEGPFVRTPGRAASFPSLPSPLSSPSPSSPPSAPSPSSPLSPMSLISSMSPRPLSPLGLAGESRPWLGALSPARGSDCRIRPGSGTTGSVAPPVAKEETARSPGIRSRRAPTTKRMPTSLAATCARTTPASVLRSVSASAARPSSAARSTSSSGCEPPRRNEKLLVICSSA